jgi:GGDEF domain-containing protein
VLKERLLATWKLARVVEWTYEIDKQIIAWQGSLKDFLGYESPVPYLTYEQFMGTIRVEDRELVRRAVEHTLKHGNDGEMVYEERFDKGVSMQLYGRWRPEKDASGKIVRLRGLSLDVTNIRHAHEREARKDRIHVHSGLPEREMISDRLRYLAVLAVRLARPFSVIGIRIHDYADVKRHMADDSLYYHTQAEIGRALMDAIPGVDTFGRLGRGSFVVILSRVSKRADIEAAERITVQGWQDALRRCDSSVSEGVAVETAAVHCPEDGTEWEGILKTLEQKLSN